MRLDIREQEYERLFERGFTLGKAKGSAKGFGEEYADEYAKEFAKGYVDGWIEQRNEDLRALIINGMSEEAIAKVMEIDIDKVRAIAKELKESK